MIYDDLFQALRDFDAMGDSVISARTPHGTYTFDIKSVEAGPDEEIVLVLEPRPKENS